MEHPVIMRLGTLCSVPEQDCLFTAAACTEILAPKVRVLGRRTFG